jgi:AraC-like DNA-binding protein
LILDGSIRLKRKDKFVTCEKDHFFIIPPYEPHAILVDDLYTMIAISIKADFVLEYKLEETLPSLLKLAEALVEKDIISYSDLQVISDAVDLLFLRIVCEYESDDDSIQLIRKALEQIPQQEVSLDELSQAAFMSKYHFIREFKKQVGLTPHHFQIQNRIRKAQCLLLEYKNASIAEVASATGFCDQSHFIKSFKKIVGLTPSQYIEAQHILHD